MERQNDGHEKEGWLSKIGCSMYEAEPGGGALVV
jgi:hypothetical protein